MKFFASKQQRVNYFLTYFLIAITGINFFSAGDGFLPIGLVISFLLFRKAGGKYNRSIFIYLFFFGLLHLMQFAIMGGIELSTLFKIIFRILLAYQILYTVGREFPSIYVNILYFFTLVSFLFYFPSLLLPEIVTFAKAYIAPITQPLFYREAGFDDIIIYNFGAQQWGRNSGPFWEPGAFVGFLSLALIFDYFTDKNIFSKKKTVFYIAILTTLSTTGYLVLFFILMYFLSQTRRRIIAFLLIPIMIPLAFYAYNNLDFLGDEISGAYYLSQNYSQYSGMGSNRFSSIYFDLDDLKKSPFVGISDNRNLRYGEQNEDKRSKTWTHRNNGVTYFLSSFGLLGFGVYFFLLYISFSKLARYHKLGNFYAFFMFLVIILIGISEKYFTRELFFGLSILFTIIPSYYKERNG